MSVIVETGYGRLEGVQEACIQAFRGIPFARPPVGPLRFRPPEPPEPWGGVREASRFGPSAPQSKVRFDLIDGLDVGAQSEDCLYLNVFTPAVDRRRRPVLVWIHGGAFVIGSGSQGIYDVRPLARRGDAVLVSINYRLGALGFLHLADLGGEPRGATGNAGILDQVAALEWVRDNIAAFGGDPANVTIFGESAGGMSVGTLLGMPCAQGLFHRAIPQSGAADIVHAPDQATRIASMILEDLEVSPGGVDRLWEAPVEAILQAQERCTLRLMREPRVHGFAPVVDGRALPEPPLAAIRRGCSRGVAVLVGATRDEWKLFGFMDPGAASLDEAELVERIEKRVPGSDPGGASHGRRLVEAYRKAREGRAGTAPPELFFAIETDRVFRIPAVRLAEAQCAHQPNTYAYLVTWESPMLGGALGACHGIDLPFVMGAIGSKGADRFAGGGPEAKALCEKMMDAWLTFARTGDPNHPALPTWTPYGAERRATMFLGRVCEVVDSPFEEERKAWEGLF